MRELAKAGIIDLSEDFKTRFYFYPDLLYGNNNSDKNLIKAIEQGLANIQLLHDAYGYEFNGIYYIYQTRQGVHIEIPQDTIIATLHKPTVPFSKIKEDIYDINKDKLKIVSRFYN